MKLLVGKEMEESCSSWPLPVGYLSACHFRELPQKNFLIPEWEFLQRAVAGLSELSLGDSQNQLPSASLRNFICQAAPPPWSFFFRFLSFKNFIIILLGVSAGVVAVTPYKVLFLHFFLFFSLFYLILRII